MIESLKGSYEEIKFKNNNHIVLHDNIQNEDYPAHWHTSIEIVYPLENTYTVIVDKQTYLLNPGDILIIWPGIIHSLKAPSSGHRYFFQADMSILKDIHEFNSIFSLVGQVTLITPNTDSSLYNQVIYLLNDMLAEYKSLNALKEACIYSSLISLMVLLGRKQLERINTDNFVNKSKNQEYINKFMYICEYIDNHFTEDLTLDELAGMANFSKFHFARLFKQFTNMSFYKYVNQKRIAYAETLLFNPHIPITEVSLLSGYSCPAAFIRMFKQIKGCTPSEFRKASI